MLIRLTVKGRFEVVRHTGKEDVLELDFKLLLLCLLHSGDVDEEEDVHVLVLKVHIPSHASNLPIEELKSSGLLLLLGLIKYYTASS